MKERMDSFKRFEPKLKTIISWETFKRIWAECDEDDISIESFLKKRNFLKEE